MARELRLPLARLVDGTGGGGSVKSLEQMGFTHVPANVWELPPVAAGHRPARPPRRGAAGHRPARHAAAAVRLGAPRAHEIVAHERGRGPKARGPRP